VRNFPTSRNTFVVLNAYKACALCALILLHSLIWWLSPNDRFIPENSAWVGLFLIPYITLFGWFGLSFAFTAGFSLRLWVQPGWDPVERKLKAGSFPDWGAIFARVGLLLGIGFLMNYKSWYIFQFLGVSTLLIIIWLKRLRLDGLFILGMAVMVAAGPLRNYFAGSTPSYLKAIVVGDTTGNFFWPFFPWFSYLVFGFTLGHLRYKKNLRLFCLVTGALLVNFSYFVGGLDSAFDLHDIWGPGLFQPALDQLLGWTGLILISYGLFDLYFSRRIPGPYNFFQVMGRNSLVVFVLV
jgi:uncharacterized membrane protein